MSESQLESSHFARLFARVQTRVLLIRATITKRFWNAGGNCFGIAERCLSAIAAIRRYFACARVTKRPFRVRILANSPQRRRDGFPVRRRLLLWGSGCLRRPPLPAQGLAVPRRASVTSSPRTSIGIWAWATASCPSPASFTDIAPAAGAHRSGRSARPPDSWDRRLSRPK